jgi:O-antigen/teichoic acid export membrane protein
VVNSAIQQPHPYLRRIASNVGWLTAERIIRLGFGVLITVAIARRLGPERFGQLNYGIAMATLVGVAASLGLDSVVQRDLVRMPAERNQLAGTCFVLKAVAGILGYILLVAIVKETVPEPATRATCFIVGLGLLANGSFAIDNWFQAHTQGKFTAFAQGLSFLIAATIRILLLCINAGLLAFAWAFSAEPILTGILFLVLFHAVAGSLKDWKFDRTLARRWLTESWPLLLSGLAIIVYTRIDQIMLAHLANDRALGIYSAAVRISEIGYFIPPILAASVLPSIVRTRESDIRKYDARRQHYFDLSVVLAVGIALPTTLLAGPIIRLLYGNAYAEAVPILCALAWATLFAFMGGARQQYLITEGYMKFSFAATLVAAVMNILLNIFLIPHYQGFGAAIATLISYGLSAVFSSFFFYPTREIGWEQLKAFNLFGALWRLASYSKEISSRVPGSTESEKR